MHSKKLMIGALVGVVLVLAPVSALAENPVFGNVKHKTLTAPALKKVTGQGPVADYYGRLGRQALANSDYWAYYGIIYNGFNAEDTYYWNAYVWANRAANRLYSAWYYAGE